MYLFGYNVRCRIITLIHKNINKTGSCTKANGAIDVPLSLRDEVRAAKLRRIIGVADVIIRRSELSDHAAQSLTESQNNNSPGGSDFFHLFSQMN